MTSDASATPDSTPGPAFWRLAALAAGLLGLALRWPGLSRFPFEQDELYTLQEARELFSTTLLPGIDGRPLYYLLHHAVSAMLPPGELGARLPAFVFGAAGLFVTYRLGRYLGGMAAGFLCLLLVSLSPWHIYVSGEARYYSLVYLAAVTAILLLLRARETDRIGHHAGAALCLIVGSLTHPTFMFPMLGVAAALNIEPAGERSAWRWPTKKAVLACWLPTALILGAYFLNLKLTGRGSTLSNWNGRGWLATVRLVPAMAQLVSTGVLAGALAGFVLASRSSSNRARRFAAICAGGLLAGVGLLVAASLRTDVYADYGVAMLPLILAAAGCLALLGLGREPSPGAPIALGLILGAAALPETVSQVGDGMRFDYRPAFARILAVGPSLPALVWPKVIQEHYAPTIHGIEFSGGEGQLDSLAARSEAFWVVASEKRQGMVGDDGGRTSTWLDRNCHRSLTTTGRRLDFRYFRVVLFACGTASAMPPR